ncbi:MAG: tRNA 2-thiouridine(34) synthase MnmA [Kiritimatiellaeota bacterium]|nr:tRNA 2-thiouridine(34) synthase MnmA [Kiritimatiellota bacterium]
MARIAVGLSGGVDSSVAAATLVASEHEVIGITMRLWREGRYKGGEWDACFGPGETKTIARAQTLCKKLGIAHHVIDCADAHEALVLDYFRKEYLEGRTPNPCVRCNAMVKFGVLPHLARQAGLHFDLFATGHYARIHEEDGAYQLWTGVEPQKDQSYFLYRLTQEQLSGLMFPVGHLRKAQVRELAQQFRLDMNDQPESQDFYSGAYSDLLKVAPRPGNIVEADGTVLGRHEGFWNFTIGQRKGLGFAIGEPRYVLDINPCRNEVIVGKGEAALRHGFTVGDLRWIGMSPPSSPLEATLKPRSTARPVHALLTPTETGTLSITVPHGIFAPAEGQSAVFYHGSRVLGGGIILE